MPPHGAELGTSKDWYGCYIILLKLQMTFHLGLDATKNMHFFKKSFKWKLLEIEFCIKKAPSANVYLPMERS